MHALLLTEVSLLSCFHLANLLMATIHVLCLQAVEIARVVFTAMCSLAWFIHFGEAVYAHHVAKKRGRSPSVARQWCTQTLLLGSFSLYYLRRQVCSVQLWRGVVLGWWCQLFQWLLRRHSHALCCYRARALATRSLTPALITDAFDDHPQCAQLLLSLVTSLGMAWYRFCASLCVPFVPLHHVRPPAVASRGW